MSKIRQVVCPKVQASRAYRQVLQYLRPKSDTYSVPQDRHQESQPTGTVLLYPRIKSDRYSVPQDRYQDPQPTGTVLLYPVKSHTGILSHRTGRKSLNLDMSCTAVPPSKVRQLGILSHRTGIKSLNL
jgi:hypothetical protein